MKPRRARLVALPALLLSATLAVAACGGAEDSGDGATSDAAGSGAGDVPAAASRPGADGLAAVERGALDADAEGGGTVGGSRGAAAEQPAAVQRSVIRKGDVALRAGDVGKAQFEVQRVADRFAGQVTEEETTTDDEGRPAYTRMVLRIPTADFADAMEALKDAAELESASSSEDDVTAKVIDTRTRLAAQRRSIARITVLFDRAESIGEIMRIESELSRRQAALESLQRQAAYLRGQTSMSTITVSIDQVPAPAATRDDTDDAGFLTGLSAGWDSLTAFAVGLATAFGAVLPWLVALGILGIPALLIWRRRRAGSPGRTPSAA